MSKKALSVIVKSSKENKITMEEELHLVKLSLNSNENLLSLIENCHYDLERLLSHMLNSMSKNILFKV